MGLDSFFIFLFVLVTADFLIVSLVFGLGFWVEHRRKTREMSKFAETAINVYMKYTEIWASPQKCC